MSKTREIDRSDWNRSLAELSKQEENHPVHIEVIGQEIGDEMLVKALPFLGVSVDRKDRDAVDLLIGRQGDSGALDHRIAGAKRVMVLESDDGEIECLDIENADGKTLVRFD